VATANIPPHAQFSVAAEFRNNMYANSMSRLQHIAWRALNVLGKRNSEFVVICIQVDSPWRDLVDLLMPGYDWQSIRDKREEPIARGSAGWSICEIVAERLPDIAAVVLEVPPEGKVKVIVLSTGGGTIYELEPKRDNSSST
jgi:hypothetical protein